MKTKLTLFVLLGLITIAGAVEITNGGDSGVIIEIKDILSFLGLRDTPLTYSGSEGYCVAINSMGTALVFQNCTNATVVTNESKFADIWLTDEGEMDNVADILGSEIINDLNWIDNTNLAYINNTNKWSINQYFNESINFEFKTDTGIIGFNGSKIQFVSSQGETEMGFLRYSDTGSAHGDGIRIDSDKNIGLDATNRILFGSHAQINDDLRIGFGTGFGGLPDYRFDYDSATGEYHFASITGFGYSATGFRFNSLNRDTNFIIDGDTNDNIFFLDAGTERVGIGTGIPSHTLTVVGDINISALPQEDSTATSMYVCWDLDGHLFVNETGCR